MTLFGGFPFGQQGKISSGVDAYIDKPSGTLCPKIAHTSKKKSLKPPVYSVFNLHIFYAASTCMLYPSETIRGGYYVPSCFVGQASVISSGLIGITLKK